MSQLKQKKNGIWTPVSGPTTVFNMNSIPSYTAEPPTPAYGGGEVYSKQGGLYFKDYLGNTTILVAEKGGYPTSYLSMLHFEGDLTDDIGAVWVKTGAVDLTTSKKKFGASALNFPGSGTLVRNTSLVIGTGNFEYDFQIYFESSPGGWTQIFGATNTGGVAFAYVGGTISMGCAGIADLLNASLTLSAQTFHHIKFGRRSGVGYILADGALVASGAVTRDYGTFNIKMGEDVGGGRNLTAVIDELRISTELTDITTYTPPTAAYAPVTLTEPPAIPIPSARSLLDIPIGVPATLPEAGKLRIYGELLSAVGTYVLKAKDSAGTIYTL